MSRIFILEDEIDHLPRREILSILKGHIITIARSVEEAKHLYTHPYDLLLLDHDMEGRFESPNHPNTGSNFVAWLVTTGAPKVETLLHSQNFHGRAYMRQILQKAGWSVDEHSFGPHYIEFLKSRFTHV